MGSKSIASIGKVILQIALGAMLTVAGIWALQGGGDAAVSALKGLFDRDVGNVIALIFGIIELLAGIFLILELFIGDKFGSLGGILSLIVIIVWCIAIVVIDFIGKGGLFNDFNTKHFLSWLYNFACHAVVLGALIYIKD